MDWTFSASSLKLFEWLRLEDIHFWLYCAKMDSIDILEWRTVKEK